MIMMQVSILQLLFTLFIGGIFGWLFTYVFYTYKENKKFITKMEDKLDTKMEDKLDTIEKKIDTKKFMIRRTIVFKDNTTLITFWEQEECKKLSPFKVNKDFYNWYYNRSSPYYTSVSFCSQFDGDDVKGTSSTILNRDEIKKVIIEKGYFDKEPQ